MFLAILELVRHHGMRAEQNDMFGEIWLLRDQIEKAQADGSS
jgi:chromatin segregation and condensation protein Rec8/ScpA/Scc1 (kleisin family)